MSSRVGRVSQSHSFIIIRAVVRPSRLPAVSFNSIRRFVLYGAQRVRRMRAPTARSARASAMRASAKRTRARSISTCFRQPRARRGIHLSEECEARVRDISPTASASIPLRRPCNANAFSPSTSRVDADLDADLRYRCDRRFATIQLERTRCT